jgi:hypothetical protein
MATRRRLTTDFNLGGEQAEADPLLERAFFESDIYAAIASRANPHCFLIGRTGSGKSAALQRLEETKGSHVIRINPEDLSLPYILDLGVVQRLSELGVHLDPFFIALWKHVLLIELIRHRYQVDSPEAKRNFLATLTERVRRDPGKKAALEYLDEFGESFWCETEERVREITENFEKKIGGTASMDVPLPGIPALTGEASSSSGVQVRSEQTERYQRIVNDTQLASLNKMIRVLDEEILDSPQHFTYVLIDDLDRDWVDDQLTNDLIRCLFRAVLDLQKVRQLKIVVALRTNIFDYLNFGSRTGGQEEKFRSLAFAMTWTRRDLVALSDERAQVAADIWNLPDVAGIADLLPATTKQRGRATDFILDRTLLRPRDVIAFLNECVTRASGKRRLSWADLHDAEPYYSENRLLALRDEWKPTFPDISKVFDLFRSCPPSMSRVELSTRLDEAALLPADPAFAGVSWMTQLSEPLWSGVGIREWPELYQPLVGLLYDIGFLGIRIAGVKVHFAHDTPGFAYRPTSLRESAAFVVHPAFHAALGISTGRRDGRDKQ